MFIDSYVKSTKKFEKKKFLILLVPLRVQKTQKAQSSKIGEKVEKFYIHRFVCKTSREI